MWKIAVLVLVGLALGLSFADVLAGHISFRTITPGFIAKYHEQPVGTFKQDLAKNRKRGHSEFLDLTLGLRPTPKALRSRDLSLPPPR